jgi:isopenicillin N synthase-like dioxygenase
MTASLGRPAACPVLPHPGDEWTLVDPVEDAITINIGDMLMRWSDDRLKSNFHRVKPPGPGDDNGAR